MVDEHWVGPEGWGHVHRDASLHAVVGLLDVQLEEMERQRGWLSGAAGRSQTFAVHDAETRFLQCMMQKW